MNMETKKENEKKVYRIGDKIEENKIMEISRGITKKALKIIEASSVNSAKNKKSGYNVYVTRLLENKDLDTLEDLHQIVAMQLFRDNYIITKECYRIVNKYIYNYKKEKVNNVEIIVNDDENFSNIDRYSYINYIKEEKNILENKEIKRNFSIDVLQLTEKQKEILNIYSKMLSYEKTAELLGISKGAVQTTIKRIREKTIKCCYAFEY